MWLSFIFILMHEPYFHGRYIRISNQSSVEPNLMNESKLFLSYL